jgi:hypothetical protein
MFQVPSDQLMIYSRTFETGFGKGRFLVDTLPKEDVAAGFHLRPQWVGAFFRQYRKLVRHAGKSKVVKVARSPRYLFAALDHRHNRWWLIRSAFNVSSRVTCSDHLAAVPQAIVEVLIEQGRENMTTLEVALSKAKMVLGRIAEMGRVLQMMGRALPVAPRVFPCCWVRPE